MAKEFEEFYSDDDVFIDDEDLIDVIKKEVHGIKSKSVALHTFEIKQGNSGRTTDIYIDGKRLTGVISFDMKIEPDGSDIPIVNIKMLGNVNSFTGMKEELTFIDELNDL